MSFILRSVIFGGEESWEVNPKWKTGYLLMANTKLPNQPVGNNMESNYQPLCPRSKDLEQSVCQISKTNFFPFSWVHVLSLNLLKL